jgi:putative ABC transport system permease protein
LQRGDPCDSWSTIVGVVADVRHTSLEKSPEPTIYEPARWEVDSVAIRTALPKGEIVTSVRNAMHEIDPAIGLSDIQTMRERITEAAAHRTFQTVLLAAFAGIAVLLALIGLYGLLSYAVRQRTAEIGVRMALGAGQAAVIGMVVRHGLMLTGIGLAAGLLASAALARWSAAWLYGVRALDPVTFVIVPAFMLTAAAIACVLPAWKAARIDPIRSLREQ